MAASAATGHDGVMQLPQWPPDYSGLWMYLFLAFSVLCLAWIVRAGRGPGPGWSSVGLSAALIPVTMLYLVACGINMPQWILPRNSGGSGLLTLETGSLLPTGTQPVTAFWLSVALVTAAAVLTLRAPQRAACLAAVSLLAFGLWQAYLALTLHPGFLGGYNTWYAFLMWWTDDQLVVVWLAALACVAAGSFGVWKTIVADVLTRRNGLTAQVQHLTVTRADAVDSAAAELRRLERDLHDGAQARLVSLGINLRAAEKLVGTSPNAAEALIVECRETASRALAELRDLVRGIYPPVLADRGLADAVRSLALDCPTTITTEIALPGRPPTPVESAVYFAIAEILNNVATHAKATSADIRAEHDGGTLRVSVTDDGIGGAEPGRGTGLSGIERRLAAFDGILAVSSPVGGPTTVVIEVPCALSSPKISIS
jgi:signal transduction histidine kinase